MKRPALILPFALTIAATTVHSKPEGPIEPLPPLEVKINHCGLHHVALRTGEVPILYGMYLWDDNYETARQQTFPPAQTHTFGGCVVRKAVIVSRTGRILSRQDSPRRQTVRFCHLCRIAEKSWLKSHNYGPNWSKPIESTPTIVLPKKDKR